MTNDVGSRSFLWQASGEQLKRKSEIRTQAVEVWLVEPVAASDGSKVASSGAACRNRREIDWFQRTFVTQCHESDGCAALYTALTKACIVALPQFFLRRCSSAVCVYHFQQSTKFLCQTRKVMHVTVSLPPVLPARTAKPAGAQLPSLGRRGLNDASAASRRVPSPQPRCAAPPQAPAAD